MADTPTPPPPRCMNLCCKAMVAFGESYANDPDYQEGVGDFWCIRTSKNLGPDGRSVSLQMCSPERECFQEY